MSKRKRNHYVPRFMLNRFASRMCDGKHFIWLLRAGKAACEVSTRDAAVGKYFYGRPETQIEERLGPVETAQSGIIRRIEAGDDPNDYSSEISELVWTLAIRTNALRSSFANSGQQMIDALSESAQSPDAAGAMKAEVSMLAAKEIDRLFPGLSPAQMSQLITQLHVQLEQLDVGEEVRGMLDKASREIDLLDSAQSGQIRGITGILDSPLQPKLFKSLRWTLVEFVEDCLILGDACVFAWDDTEQEPTFPNYSKTARDIYLPLSPRLALVGQVDASMPTLPLETINEASASISCDAVFANRVGNREADYSKLIGRRAVMLRELDARRMARDAWSNLGDS